jgi:hypothetical protein
MTTNCRDSVLAFAAIGVLSPIPLFAVFAAIVVVADLSGCPEGFAPAIGLLCWLGVAWAGSDCLDASVAAHVSLAAGVSGCSSRTPPVGLS